MRISKEEFVEYVKAYQEYEELLRKLEDVMNVCLIESKFEDFADKVYNIIHSMFDFDMEDEDIRCYGSDLDYFMWELDCGRNWESGMVETDGEDVDWSSPEKFYDYLVAVEEGRYDNGNGEN